jgi:hypothetical protein
MAKRFELIQQYLLQLSKEELRVVGDVAWWYLCLQPRVWRWWSYQNYPLVLG